MQGLVICLNAVLFGMSDSVVQVEHEEHLKGLRVQLPVTAMLTVSAMMVSTVL